MTEQVEQAAPVIAEAPSQKPLGRIYDIPKTNGQLTPEAADAAIRKFHSDVLADPNHPYLNRNHPLHGDNMKYAAGLHELSAAGKKDPYEQVMENAKVIEKKEADTRYAEAVEDVDKLKELGSDTDSKNVPFDISEGIARCVKMQRLNAEGGEANIRLMSQMMGDDMSAFREKPELQQLFESFNLASGGLDKNLRHDLAKRIIEYLYDAHEAAESSGRPVSVRKKNPKRFGG